MYDLAHILTAIAFVVFVIVVFIKAFFPKRKETFHARAVVPIPSGLIHRMESISVRGRKFFSVSSAVPLFFKTFDRELWAARKADSTGRSADEILEEWAIKGERARQSGIFLREQTARYFAGGRMKGGFRFKFKGSATSVSEYVSLEKEEALFMDFVSHTELRVYRTNYLVADRSLRIAGRVAFIGVCEGGYVLYDWKKASGITDANGNAITVSAAGDKGTNGLENVDDTPFWRYALQMNLYRAILEKNYHLSIKAMYLVDVSADKKNPATVSVPFMNDETAAVMKYLSRQ